MAVIELSGGAYERGLAHGQALADTIASFSESIMRVHEANVPYTVSRDELVAYCRSNLDFLRDYSPALASELEGIAAGSGLGLDDIMLLNSFLELEDIRPAKLGKELMHKGCTSFNALPEFCADGHALLGQTFDMEEYYTKYNVLLRITHGDGHKELVYSLAGILGLNGMNSSGIGVCINKLVATDAKPGVPYPALVRGALAQRRIGDAFGAVIFAPRACGMNYQIASDDGIAWCAEVSAGDYDLLGVDGAVAHSNYYLSERMRTYETPGWLSHGGAYVRYQVASRALEKLRGRLTVDDLFEISRDHTNYPRCICAHGFDGQNEYEAFSTIAATFYDLTEQTAYICNGRPCQSDFHQYKL